MRAPPISTLTATPLPYTTLFRSGGGSEKKPVGRVVFARAERGADPADVIADAKDFGDQGRGGVRLQAALCALELLMPDAEPRSEEHTSELQSLMRISYDVFCLTKTKNLL